MKLAVISDIHGNRLALEAALEDIARQGADACVNLGDLVSGPMEPDKVADILMDAAMPTVRGNHDRVLVEAAAPGPVDRFAQARLRPGHMAWLAGLPATLTLRDDVFLCHGTPTSDETPWLDGWWQGRTVTTPDAAEVAAAAEGVASAVMLCGHTHVAHAVRLRDGRLIVNPGSVGLQVNNGSPDARYAMLAWRDGHCHVAFHAVPYDHEGAARQAEANGFPQWRAALVTGWASSRGLF